MKKFILSLLVCTSICCQMFASTPEILGPDVLCDSAVYSLQNVPNNATITWTYVRPANISSACTPLYVGSGQGTRSVYFRRGGEMRIESSGPGFEQPDLPWEPTSLASTPVFRYIKYEGFITIKAIATFNNTTYTVTKEIYMPEKVEIDDQGMGFGNPWIAGETKAITLESPLSSEIVANILWEVDMVGGSSFTRRGVTSIVLTPTNSVTTISITATYLKGCGDDNQTCTKVFPVLPSQTLSFVNPALGNVEINVWNGDASDANMRTINNPEPYMGAYRLELWHDLYGKVREIDVAENTPTVTMNLDGLNSGVYILRLIIDNQIITAEQLIVK